MERLPEENKKTRASSGSFRIHDLVREKQEDFESTLLMLCGGSHLEKEALKRSKVGDYITKLKAYVDAITGPEEKKMQGFIAAGKDKRKK